MQTKKIIAIIVLLALLCGCLYIRFSLNKPAEENPTLNSETEHNTPAPEATPDALPETAPEAPAAPPRSKHIRYRHKHHRRRCYRRHHGSGRAGLVYSAGAAFEYLL